MKRAPIYYFSLVLMLTLSCSKELYPVKKGNKFGFENKKKELVIEAKYPEVSGFHEGFAKVGFYVQQIDSVWNEPMFEENGYWTVNKYKTIKYSFIDKNDSIFKLELPEAKQYSNGMAAARLKAKWGYLNTQGQWQIKPQFADASNFEGNKAQVIKESKDGHTWYYLEIDNKGNVVKNDQVGKRKPDWFDSIPDWHTLMASGNIYIRLTDYESAFNYYSAATRRINQIESEDTLAYMELCQEMAYFSAMRVEETLFEKYDLLAQQKLETVLASKIPRRRMVVLKHIDYLVKLADIRELNLQYEQEIETLERILDVVKKSGTEDINLYWDIEERIEELKE